MATKDITKIESELKPLESEVQTLKEAAEKMVISNDVEYAHASDALAVVNKKEKAIEKMRKFFVDPLNLQVKNINAMFKPQVNAADEIVQIIKKKMVVYYDIKEAARIKEQKRLDDIRDAANKKREEKGQEAIAEPVREVAMPAKTVVTDNSASNVRKVWTCEILHINELPDEIKQIVLGEAFKKGIVKSVVQAFVERGVREMPGARIYEETRMVAGNYRGY